MTDVGTFALSEMKAQLDAALIRLETRYGIDHGSPEAVAVREAGDKLFSGLLKRKFTILSGLHDPDRGYTQAILRQRAEEGAREPGEFPH